MMPDARRRILFLLPFPPRSDSTHGGGRVTAQLLAGMTVRHSVALLYFRAAGEPPAEESLQKQCDLVEEVVRPDIGFSLADRWSRLTSLFRGKPLWATGLDVAAYGMRVRRLAQTFQPDIVQAEFHVMGQYFSALDGCGASRVLTLHEIGTSSAHDFWRSQRGFARAMCYLDLRAWQRYEQKIIREAQAVVVFTDKDRQAIAQFANQTQIVKIPFGVVLPEHPSNPLSCTPLSLLFLGSFIHPPNVDAAIRLIDKIFPRLQACIPDLLLYIVGDQPTRQISKRGKGNVIVTGKVPEVTSYINQAAVVVVPVRLGGGMRVKVVEALAAGKAMVASPRAIEGLDLVDGEQVLVAESDDQFCDAIVQLLADPAQRSFLGRRARAWARDNLSWESSITAYEKLYHTLLVKSGLDSTRAGGSTKIEEEILR